MKTVLPDFCNSSPLEDTVVSTVGTYGVYLNFSFRLSISVYRECRLLRLVSCCPENDEKVRRLAETASRQWIGEVSVSISQILEGHDYWIFLSTNDRFETYVEYVVPP